jgi:signal transduction histidine kinase
LATRTVCRVNRILSPWSTARTWHALAFVGLDLPFGVIAFTLTVTLFALTVGLLVTFLLALPVAWVLFASTTALGAVERSRIGALLDTDLPNPHAALQPGSVLNRLGQRVKSASRWRELAYLLLSLPVGVLAFAVVVSVWSGSFALAALPTYVSALPGGTAAFGLFDVGSGAAALVAAAIGLLGVVVVAPWTMLGVVALQRGLAIRLLAPGRESRLAAEVSRLESRRVSAVDSAESERRRIERDLHDGAQQRLVKLGMDLGMAHEHFDDDPATARRLVGEAHLEAKAALVELRDLVRGFHPAILEDRGLDAALSAVVARSAVPVSLRIEASERPSAAVESAAYFIIVEAVTNVAKHAHATKASVSVERRGDRLAIDVSDDGVGGATLVGGTGLVGLVERVNALGGWLHLLSPTGGPTTVLVELPCAS